MPRFLHDSRALPAGTAPWFATALGQAWLQQEQEIAADMLERVFGYDAVSLDAGWPGQLLLAPAATHRRTSLGPGLAADIRHNLDRALPYSEASIDAVLLPHTLEFVDSPHGLLREADRVLVGEGHLLVFGFNPYSSWRLLAPHRRHGFPARPAWLSEARLRDWLGLLGFEVLACKRFFRRLPVNRAGWLERSRWLEKTGPLVPACGYALLARKHTHGMTPLGLSRARLGMGLGPGQEPARSARTASNVVHFQPRSISDGSESR
ncbi:MAG: methyltransferase domain-containing protein [Gammaproteobacteria bacterium]|nr:methyltransferase domain-containing protein [Gammaproteobacteria bacterium]